MKTIKKLISQSKKLDGNTRIKLQLQIPLKKLRANSKLLASLGASKIKVVDGKKADAEKIGSSKGGGKAVRKTAKPKKPVLKTKLRAAKPVTGKATKPAAKKTPAKPGKTAGLTQAAVLAAMRAGSGTSQAIAAVTKASPTQVSRALSRYARQGLIVRTAPGQYALKPS